MEGNPVKMCIRDRPKIDQLSREGDPLAIHFPKAKIEDAPYDFSFSGLKSYGASSILALGKWIAKGSPSLES